LVLERAGARAVDCLVAACDEDATNLEICRLSRECFNVPLLAAVVREADLLPQFQALGVQTVLIGTSLAVALANRIEPAVQASEGLGLGHGELMEVTIPASSPVLGRPLRTYAADYWLIAAVYRQGSLIIPHGHTSLQENDRILLVGSPMLLPGIADYLRLGRAQFPYPYGSRLAVVLEKPTRSAQAAVQEAQRLADASAAEGLDFLVWGEGNHWKRWENSLARVLSVPPDTLSARSFFQQASAGPSARWGCVVIPSQRLGWRHRFGWRRSLLDEVLAYLNKPVLLARGVFPYRQVVALVQSDRVSSGGAASLRGLQAALSVGSTLKLEVRALAVTAPTFIAGETVAATRQEIEQAILTLAATYRMRVELQHLTGNPIRETQARLDAHDLLVVRMPRRARASFFRPDVGRYLALRVPCSVLIIPDE
jgi:Trk K+ transport system NAD-binding subunit/nucleotide-binding universal stress UspA family protein